MTLVPNTFKALPEPIRLIFRILGFESGWLLGLVILAPLPFKAKCYGGSSPLRGVSNVIICSLLFIEFLAPSCPLKAKVCLGLNSSLYFWLWSLFCQSLDHFLGYVCLCSCYLIISLKWGELTVLVLCHLPLLNIL